MHDHVNKEGESLGVDEVSLVYYGDDQVYRGPLNLAEVNTFVRETLKRLRSPHPARRL
jgi:hypothetical protein